MNHCVILIIVYITHPRTVCCYYQCGFNLFVFQKEFSPELYYLCLSLGIFSVLSTGRQMKIYLYIYGFILHIKSLGGLTLISPCMVSYF